MSSIEQALRQIDSQTRHLESGPANAGNGEHSSLAAPVPPPARTGGTMRWTFAGLLGASLLVGAWSLGRHSSLEKNTVASAGPDSPAAAERSLAQPAHVNRPAFQPEGNGALSPNASDVLERPDWLDHGAGPWDGGMKDEAARIWANGLRSESPDRLALLLADGLTLPEAHRLYREWAGVWPVLALRQVPSEPERWMILVVPAERHLATVRDRLAQVSGSRIQWGSISHWLARTAPLPPPMLAASSQTGTPEPKLPEPTPSAPALSAPPGKKPPEVAIANAPQASTPPAPPPQPSPAQPAPAVAEPPAPELKRTANGNATEAGSPGAAKAIANEYALLEQKLAQGHYAAALDGVSSLEKDVGTTWRTRYLTGVALSGLERWSDAAVALTEARRLNPDHVQLTLYLSVAQQELGAHADALGTLTQLQATHAELPEIWLNQGHSYQAMGRTEEARVAFRRFMILSKGRPDLQAQRQWVTGQLGDLQ